MRGMTYPWTRATSPMWTPRSAADSPTEGQVTTPEPAKEIALIRFEGALTAQPGLFEKLFGETMGTAEKLRMAIAAADAGPASITLLHISSGGGDVEGMLETQSAIANASNFLAVWTEVAFSGALVAISGADVIGGPPTADVGSLSVRMTALDESQALKDAGLEVIVESPDSLKRTTAPGVAIDRERRKQMLETATDLKAAMLPPVAAGRGMTVEALDALGAAHFVGEKAVAAGLMDKIFPDMAAFVASLSQPDKEADMADEKKTAGAPASPPVASAELSKPPEPKAADSAVETMLAKALETIEANTAELASVKADNTAMKSDLDELKAAGVTTLVAADTTRLAATALDADGQKHSLEVITMARAAGKPELVAAEFERAESAAKALDPAFRQDHGGSAHDVALTGVPKDDKWVKAAASGADLDQADMALDMAAMAYASKFPEAERLDRHEEYCQDPAGCDARGVKA